MFCRNCGAQTDDAAQFCIKCGANLQEPGAAAAEPQYVSTPPPSSGYAPPPPPPGATPVGQWAPPAGATPKSKLAAALLGIFLGVFGIHRFYLGYTSIGVIQLIVGIVTCGIASSIWGLIEGILILTGSIDRDANGVPLRD
jgi:TM2 domain-containing membrane protein YozV